MKASAVAEYKTSFLSLNKHGESYLQISFFFQNSLLFYLQFSFC